MIWLLTDNTRINFKQKLLNVEIENIDDYIIYKNNEIETKLGDEIHIKIYNNIISYECDNKRYTYRYEENYVEDGVEYEYIKVDDDEMPSLRKKYYEYNENVIVRIIKKSDKKMDIIVNNFLYNISLIE